MKNKLFIAALASTMVVPAIVAPVQADSTEKDFTDVGKGYWAYKEIMDMKKDGIINGYPDGTFKPANSISRVHVASLFTRGLNLKPIREGKEFTDVPKTHLYYEDIQKVYRAGIFDGKPDGSFGVGDNLSRAQMAKVLYYAFNLESHKGYIFSDVTEKNWAKDYIASLYVSGITTGSNGLFRPNGTVSRAEYATFLHRALYPEQAPVPEKPLEKDPINPKPEQPTEPQEPETPVEEFSDLAEEVIAFKQENSDLFVPDVPIFENAFYGFRLPFKVIEESKEVVRNTNLKYYLGSRDYFGDRTSFRLTMDGYVNPTERFTNTALAFSSLEEDGAIEIMYDFRLDSAHEVAKEWVRISMPEYADHILPIMDIKVMEARRGEVRAETENVSYPGNFRYEDIGQFELGTGVNSFFEWMNIQLLPKNN